MAPSLECIHVRIGQIVFGVRPEVSVQRCKPGFIQDGFSICLEALLDFGFSQSRALGAERKPGVTRNVGGVVDAYDLVEDRSNRARSGIPVRASSE